VSDGTLFAPGVAARRFEANLQVLQLATQLQIATSAILEISLTD